MHTHSLSLRWVGKSEEVMALDRMAAEPKRRREERGAAPPKT